MNKKGAIELPDLAWWLIGIFVFLVVGYFILKLTGKLDSGVSWIKDFFRFR